MTMSKISPLWPGILAIASGVAEITFDIIFAVTLSQASSPTDSRVTAIVASGVGSVTVGLLVVLLARQVRYRDGANTQYVGHWKKHTYLLAGFAGCFNLLSAVVSAIVLGIMRNRIPALPLKIANLPTRSMISGGFVVWAVALLSQAVFIIWMVLIQRRQSQVSSQGQDEERTTSDMQESRPQQPSTPEKRGHSASYSIDSRSPPSSAGRSRSGSETMYSLRNSFGGVVRPMTSKTKLINPRSSHRTSSINSSHRTLESIEDGFDSWDTSAVDAQSRHAVETASSPPQRFLETIPASPTTSRSGSPGFPLDLEPPPRIMSRTRSYSPAASLSDRPRSGATSPVESLNEAHIHPLFRTDSPTPPPAATPGTVVTAAPGAGQVISDRGSIRSLSRMRSGSLPSSPMMHTPSLDSIRRTMEREERDILEEEEDTEVERSMTPPIPDWILGAGSRSSFQGYTSRKNSKRDLGLGVVGEER